MLSICPLTTLTVPSLLHQSPAPGLRISAMASATPSRDWSTHSKLSKLFKGDLSITKKIKIIAAFYGQTRQHADAD